MPLTEASLSVWLFAFARLAGWAVFDPLVGRLPLLLRLFLAAVLAAVLAPGLMPGTATPFTVQGLLALGMEAAWGAALALCVWLVFAAVSAARNQYSVPQDRLDCGARQSLLAQRVKGGRAPRSLQTESGERSSSCT